MPKPRLKEPVRFQVGYIEKEAAKAIDAHIESEKRRREESNGEGHKYGKVYNRSVFVEEAVDRIINGECSS